MVQNIEELIRDATHITDNTVQRMCRIATTA